MNNATQLGDLSPAGAIAIGILVGLLSTCIQSIGLTLQRKSHLLEDEKDNEDLRRPPYRRRRWQIGMFMFIISNLVGSTIQITTLPLPVLSTLQASGLVFNTLCATIILKERFTKWSLVGTALVAGGALLIAMFGALAEPSHTLQQLLNLLGRMQFILWMIGTFVVIALILLSIIILNRMHPHSQSHALRVYKGFAYGGVSSILSAHSLLVAKSAVELLVRTIIDHKNQFDRWQSWIILLLLVTFALTQLYFLHRGLKLVSTSILYPFVFCIYNIIAILDGLIYFHQTSRLSTLHAGLIALGTAILLSGVLCLSWRINEESDSPPPADAHTLLTPGMGLVEDTTTEDERDSDIDDDNASVTSADEEAGISLPSETTPLLLGRTISQKGRDDSFLHIIKGQRRGTPYNAEEQLHDEPADASHDEDWTFPAPEAPDLNQTSDRRASTAFESSLTGSLTAQSKSQQPRGIHRHKRIRSEDLTVPTKGSLARASRDSSASPCAPRSGITRASTVHGSAVSFATSGLQQPVTWRERDRDRRRRTWSRAPALPGLPGAIMRGRSVSAPQGRRVSVQRQLRRGSGAPRGAEGAGDGGAARPGTRSSSLVGWFGSLFANKDGT